MIAPSTKRLIFFLALNLFIYNTALPALLSGSLVLTHDGPTPIEQLQIGNSVTSRADDGTLKQTKIIHIKKRNATLIIELLTKDTEIYTTPEQLFFDPQQNKWIKAQDLTAENWFIDDDSNLHKCVCVTKIKTDAAVYDLSLARPHTFFISESHLLTHNILPVAIGAGIAWGTGAITFEGITVAIGGIAVGIAGWLGFRKNELSTG